MSETATRPIGVDRADPLLSLEDDAQHVRRALLTMARHLWSTTLWAHSAPLGVEQFDRMRAPRPGDYVAEHSAAFRAAAGHDTGRWYHGFGVLIEARRESAPGVVDAAGGEVFYVQYGPAAEDVVRWENAEMLAIPLAGVDWPH